MLIILHIAAHYCTLLHCHPCAPFLSRSLALSFPTQHTKATWNQSRNGFVINTPSRSAEKNWISQGLTADWIVVFANLVLDSKNHGPHPFLFRMRDEHTGTLADGISVTDMGKKTVANDLDNAKIHFDHVFVDRTTLLNRFATILDQPVAGGGGGARRDGKDVVGVYHQVDPEQSMRIEVIGQRLMTGRLAIAEASIVCVRQLFIKTKTYADAKQVNGISGPLPLSKLPHLNKIFVDADAHFSKLEVFSASVEARLAVHLRAGSIPDPDLVEAISVAKVKNIEAATHWQHMLEQEVGSFALMGVSGFQMKGAPVVENKAMSSIFVFMVFLVQFFLLYCCALFCRCVDAWTRGYVCACAWVCACCCFYSKSSR